MITRLFAIAGLSLLTIGHLSATALTDAWGLTPHLYTDSGSTAGNWNIDSPRTETGTSDLGAGAMTWAEGNDTNNHFGSPSGGENYDLEFLAWRVEGEQLRVLGVTSLNPYTDDGSGYKVGDIFIDVDCDSHSQDGTADGVGGDDYNGYEYAISTGVAWSDPSNFVPGGPGVTHTADGLYVIDEESDIYGIVDGASRGYGDNATVRNQANPFAISNTATNIGGAQVTIENYNLGNGDGDNWVMEWVIDLADLPDFDPTQLTLHWSVECGNDWIDTDKPTSEPVVPEPATIALLGIGLATAGAARRRRANRA